MDKQLKQLARKAYLSYHEDGIIDLIIGWLAFAFGMVMATDNSLWTIFSWIPILFYVPLKERLTVPRFGYVDFETGRGNFKRMVMAFLIMGLSTSFLMGILVFLLFGRDDLLIGVWLREYFMLFFGTFLAGGFSVFGFIVGIRRLYAYALLSLVLLGSAQFLAIDDFIPVVLLGISIIASGLVLLFRFLRKYPNVSNGEPNHAG
ncbi:MAG: hypothetical protein DWQ07_07740 [Chloroflexi bacterium]|nr:MAG: hypothetical protein DWQ07_07740 [Chloroflexota bacterium]MBL1197356.1 hypothetical protein [Chloroflexota bacterium]NOH14653.1 hypothetical protein [Chloroflexota bacterium]